MPNYPDLNARYLSWKRREKGYRWHRASKPADHHFNNILWSFFTALILFGIFFLIFSVFAKVARASEIPPNLWQGIVAEDTSGDYQTYLVIASVVRNRIDNGMNHGLVALKRKNLDKFVKDNCAYILKTKGLNLEDLATKAIREVLSGKDYAFGATHYEHTGVYPMPSWAKNMQVVKVMYQGTKKELTLWKKYNKLARAK